MSKKIILKIKEGLIEEKLPCRVDMFLSEAKLDLSRSYISKLIDQGNVKINGKVCKKPSQKVNISYKIEVFLPKVVDLSLEPKNLGLKVIYEDDDYVAIDKPAGLSVHPREGQMDNQDSMVKGLLYLLKDRLSGIGGVKRPGIVHRLDKDTSGLIVVAKHDKAHRLLSDQFKTRKVKKVYLALVVGVPDKENALISRSIGRSRANRKKMAINGINAREAITEYRIKDVYKDKNGNKYSLLEINLKTGRTHQIRVHMASVGHVLVGDQLYGLKKVNQYFEENYGLRRQFLHATRISFEQPILNKKIELESALSQDLQNVIEGMEII